MHLLFPGLGIKEVLVSSVPVKVVLWGEKTLSLFSFFFYQNRFCLVSPVYFALVFKKHLKPFIMLSFLCSHPDIL